MNKKDIEDALGHVLKEELNLRIGFGVAAAQQIPNGKRAVLTLGGSWQNAVAGNDEGQKIINAMGFRREIVHTSFYSYTVRETCKQAKERGLSVGFVDDRGIVQPCVDNTLKVIPVGATKVMLGPN